MKFNFTFMRCMAILMVCFTAISLQAQSDATVTITAPASVAGDYAARQAVFGPGLTADISGMIVEGVDTASLTTVCDTVANDLTGVIALVDRGACSFVAKVTNAQTKGAIAVIVCNNNQDAPNQAIVMGGDDMGTITIPSVMLSYNQCQTIRAELGNGLAGTQTTSNLIASPTGTVCTDPAVITDAGTYTATLDEGYGGLFGGSGNAAFYSYTPSQDTLITVTSCSTTDLDTRLIVIDNCTDVNVLAFNDDCATGLSSELTWLGTAGTEYIILWDDRWSGTSFDWELRLEALPLVDVTVTVDMNNEAITSVNNGGHIAGSFNGWSSVPMTDNMDGTYTYTITGITAGDSIEYKFQNGLNDVWEIFEDGESCTITDPSGTFVNRLLVAGIGNATLDPFCFNSCGACLPIATCEEPIFFFQDSIDQYTLGNAEGQGDIWGSWQDAGISGTVSDDFAFSGTQSMKIDGTNTGEDALMFVNSQANVIEGHYWLTWKMYVPTDRGAYWNIQHSAPDASGGYWAIEVDYETDGTGTVDLNGGGDDVPFTYTVGEWFDVLLLIDIDNDETRLIQGDLEVDASVVAAWPFSNAAGTASTDLNSINFFPRSANDIYYVDDVSYAVIPTPAAGDGQYCYTAVEAAEGTNTIDPISCFGAGYSVNNNTGHAGIAGLGGHWSTYTPAEDGVLALSSCGGGADTRVWIFGGECHSLSVIGANDDLCDLGNGSAWASYKEAYVTGGNTYYILWDDIWDNVGFDYELTFTAGAGDAEKFCQTATAVESNTDILAENYGDAAVTNGLVYNSSGVAPGAYAQSAWFSFTPTETDTFDITSCDAGTDTRVWVHTGSCGSIDDLTLIASSDDDCDAGSGSFIGDWVAEAGVTYYIEWDNLFSAESFIWRIEQEIIIDVDEVELAQNISVFPNPVKDQLFVQFDLSEAVDMEVRLVNTLGQVVSTKVLDAVQGETVDFNTSNLAAGTYFVQFITGQSSSSQKVVIKQ